jgi:hypothetical protein
MSYLFNEIVPFPNAAGTTASAVGKNKGVFLTNTTGSGLAAGLMSYRANGTTWENRVSITANATAIIPLRVWGVSFASGLTGGTIA